MRYGQLLFLFPKKGRGSRFESSFAEFAAKEKRSAARHSKVNLIRPLVSEHPAHPRWNLLMAIPTSLFDWVRVEKILLRAVGLSRTFRQKGTEANTCPLFSRS